MKHILWILCILSCTNLPQSNHNRTGQGLHLSTQEDALKIAALSTAALTAGGLIYYATRPLPTDVPKFTRKAHTVVFVGAGPVGLWTAIQLKHLQPHTKIVMFERHELYTRRHTLRVSPSSYRYQMGGDRLKQLSKEMTGHVRNSELEGRLKAIAQDMGIKFRYEKVEDLERIAEVYPNVDYIIGSDGSRSLVRTTAFGGLEYQKDLNYIVDIKFDVKGEAKGMGFLDSHKTLKEVDFFVMEKVGKLKDGLTPVTVRLLVDQKAFNSLTKVSSFKQAMPLSQLQEKDIDPRLKKTIQRWIAARKANLGDHIAESKVLPIKLQAYKARRAETTRFIGGKQRRVLLVGDALFGVPYFRSLNNGLLSGSRLAYHLGHALAETDPVKINRQLKDYNSYFRSLAKRQITLAKVKTATLKPLYPLTWLNSKLPLQINFWSEGTLQKFDRARLVTPQARQNPQGKRRFSFSRAN